MAATKSLRQRPQWHVTYFPTIWPEKNGLKTSFSKENSERRPTSALTSLLPQPPQRPRKRRHEESSEHNSRLTASTSPNVTRRGRSSPLAAHPSKPVTPQRRTT